jgi:hypothetical protein
MRATLLLFWLVLGLAEVCAGPGKDNPFGGRRVLLIGIDGCRADAVRTLAGDGRAPHLAKLIKDGTVTWNAFAGGILDADSQQDTSSGTGWSTILTGVWRDRHGVADNRFRFHRLAQNPHLFRRIKDRAPSAWLGSLVDWPEIHQFIVGASKVPGAGFLAEEFLPQIKTEDGKHIDYEKCDAEIEKRAVELLRSQDPDALFVYFGHLDEVGHGVAHKEGRFSAENVPYAAALAQIDGRIGSLLNAIQTRPKYAEEDWLILASTDHGGRETKHGGQSVEERTIWIIAQGGAAPKNHVVEGPVPQTAIAPTVFQHLGVPIGPEWGWEAAPFALEAAAK